MSVKKWFEEKKAALGGKVAMFKGMKGIMSGDIEMADILDLIRSIITPETSRDIAHGIADFMNEREKEAGCELIYIIRKTPDGKSAFIDVVQVQDGRMIATVKQYSENDLSQALNSINDEDAQKLLSGTTGGE
ncbi:MAG TPA: hypothetical protein VL098_12570 [Flavipsychrobacter sp.]|nr:hypothetical protein [Flavipsychrobacter sp.]